MRQLVHVFWQNANASLVPSLDSSRCSFSHWLIRRDAHSQPPVHDDRWHMTEVDARRTRIFANMSFTSPTFQKRPMTNPYKFHLNLFNPN